MQAKSIKGKSPEEIQDALEKCTGENYKSTLAIVFLSVKQDRETISKILDDKGIQIFGATTAGEFIDGRLFTYGEFGKSKKGNYEYHNNACCVVALKEK